MQPAQAKKLATLSIGTIVVVGAGKTLVVDNEFPPFRFWMAVGVTGFILSAVTDIEPQVGAGLAILAATVVMFESGEPLLRRIADMEGDEVDRIRDRRTRRLIRQLDQRKRR